jgi:hypothetical protein
MLRFGLRNETPTKSAPKFYRNKFSGQTCKNLIMEGK